MEEGSTTIQKWSRAQESSKPPTPPQRRRYSLVFQETEREPTESVDSQHKRQDKKSPVFVYATANNISGLPPELLRKGRFDEMFSVDLPTVPERRDIFAIHLAKRGRAKLINKGVNIQELINISDSFTGAEIEAAIVEGMYTAFDAEREVCTADIEEALKHSKPVAKMMAEQILAIRKWCKDRTRPANAGEVVKLVVSDSPSRSIETN